jgi:hypothetical protein
MGGSTTERIIRRRYEQSVMTQSITIDSHVHIQDCFPLAEFFDCAFANLAGVDPTGVPLTNKVLLLAESGAADYFSQIAEAKPDSELLSGLGRWSCVRLEEDSILLESSAGERLFLVAGRQIVTSDRLEVLALATARKFRDGQSTQATLAAVAAAQALPVLPWGFGKWVGRRGRIVHDLLAEGRSTVPFIGDNGGRLRWWPTPASFAVATGHGIPVLAGSDPLPFASELSSVGSYGLKLNGEFDPSQPAASVRTLLGRRSLGQQNFGHTESLFRFCMNQLRIQLRNRGSHRLG